MTGSYVIAREQWVSHQVMFGHEAQTVDETNHGAVIHAYFGPQYFTGNRSIFTRLKSVVETCLSCEVAAFMVPKILEHTFMVIRSFVLFLPSAVFSNNAARVTSGKSLTYKPVSSQLNIWSRGIFSPWSTRSQNCQHNPYQLKSSPLQQTGFKSHAFYRISTSILHLQRISFVHSGIC